MTKESYLDHLKKRLTEVEHQISEAKKFLDRGNLAQKVTAAGELTLLEADHEKVSKRIEKAEHLHADDWSQLRATFHEDLDSLSDAIEKWIVRHREIRSST